ncbi:hypothetical protein BLNAU_20064 [Blattamonas nauphoetae]|uniref:Hemerythrin-like domain-containing protein n=1 Tax=Blattamonas nauphoetae TaxID=2049346 RepID=A0ABQ9WZV0_9EUKA|nr:hypothetical protein BLNAU_20064 [Blattamonas nauphoetae]
MLLSLDNTRDVADNIGILKDMATAETLVNELTYYVKLYEIYHFNLGTLDPAIYPTFQETLDSLQEKSRELHNIAIIKLFKTDSQFLVWHQAELTYFTTIHDSGVFSYQYQSTQTLINAANGYATELYQLSGLTGSFKEDTLRDIITQTMMNGPTSLDQKFKKMICDLVMALASQNTTRMLLIIAIGVIGLVIAVAITAIVYFLLTRLNKQRNAALSFLISIKPDVLGNIQTRLTNSAELDNQEKKRAEIRKDWKSTLAAARGSLAPGMFKRPSFNQQFPGMDLQPIQGENSIEVPAHKRRKSIFAPGMLTNANSLLHNRQVSIGVHGMPLFKELSVSDEGSLPTAPIHNRRASLLMRPPAHRRGQSTPFANPADNPDQEPGFHPAPAHNRRLSIQPILPGDSTDGGMRILPQHSRAPSFAIQPSESQGHPIEGGQSLALGDELTKGSTPAQTSRSIAIKEEALKDTSEEHLDQQSINSLPKLTIPDVTELKKKKIFQNAVPPGLIASALVAYVLLLVGLLANVIVSIATTFFMQAWPVRVGLAGIRAASAQLVPFLALQVAFPEAGVKDADVVLRSSPGWTGLEHMSSSQEEVLKVFSAYQTYITNLHNLCRFGEMPPMGDSVIDPVVVYDMLTVKSVQSLLFEPDTCFLKDKSICSQKPDRMPTTGLANGVKLYGVEAMMQLLRKAMRAIEMYNSSYSDPRVISPNHHPAAYINTALRYDLKDGLARITEDIANESSTVYLTQTVLIIVFSVLNFALIVLLFFYLIVKVQSQLNHVAFKTKRIQQLIPLEETMAIRWSKAFNLGEAKLDDSHRLILDAASTLLDNLIKNEEKQLGQQAQIVHAFLHRHQKEEIKWINQSQHPDADVLCSRIQDVTKQYSLLLRKYEQGYDITHAMSTLFNYFIDVHIMEENRRTLEWVKEQKIIQGDS